MVKVHPDATAFCEAFVHSVLTWNKVEIEARKILLHLAGPSPAVFAAITHLGNVGLKDALLATTDSIADPELAEHIKHACELMDRLRAYRNHYVHGLIGMGHAWLGGAFHARTWVVEAKGKITWSEESVTPEDLRTLWQWLVDCECYLSGLARFLEGTGPDRAPCTFLDKPPLPDRLKKTRNSLLTPQDLPSP